MYENKHKRASFVLVEQSKDDICFRENIR